jgi:hypothetical protein
MLCTVACERRDGADHRAHCIEFGDDLLPLPRSPGFRADAQQCREDRALEQHTPMIVKLVLEASIAGGIGCRLVLERDRGLFGMMTRVQASSTGDWPNEAWAPCWPTSRARCGISRKFPVGLSYTSSITGALRYRRRDLVRQIGVDGGDERRRDHRAPPAGHNGWTAPRHIGDHHAPLDGAIEGRLGCRVPAAHALVLEREEVAPKRRQWAGPYPPPKRRKPDHCGPCDRRSLCRLSVEGRSEGRGPTPRSPILRSTFPIV